MKVYVLTHEPYMDNSTVMGAFRSDWDAKRRVLDSVDNLIWLWDVIGLYWMATLPHGEQYRIYEVELE